MSDELRRLPEAEDAVRAVEEALEALSRALELHDVPSLDDGAQALQRALAQAVDLHVLHALDARDPLAQRWRSAAGELRRQRERLARAVAVVDHALAPVWRDAAGDHATLDATYDALGRRPAAPPRAFGGVSA